MGGYFVKIEHFCRFVRVHWAGSEICRGQEEESCLFYVDGKSLEQPSCQKTFANQSQVHFSPSCAFSDLTSWDEKLSSADWNDDLPGHQRQPWRGGGRRGGDVEHENSDQEEVKEFLRV